MKNALLFVSFLAGFSAFGQTWSNDVAQVFYNKCTKCHHTGGIAPTSYMSYGEVSPMTAAIYDAVNTGHMPPWPPDNNYQQYVHDRSLTAAEKTLILDWIMAGFPEGIAANTPPAPVYTSNTVLGNGDLTIQIPTYMSKATSISDDYVCFSVPSGLTQNRVIKAIEIVPGNRQIVHHALIYVDPTGSEVTDTIGGNCASPSNSTTKLITGYTPGSTPMVLPTSAPMKLGIDIAAGSNIYFGMHYPSGTYGEYDSTKVIFHFYPIGTTGVRQVTADPIVQNWNFALPNNQTTTVNAQYVLPAAYPNISVLSAFPHMHLLGQTIKSYGVTPAGDTLKYVNVPQWDFHWQDFYFFKHVIKTPPGTVIKGTGKYVNNTGSTVTAGLNTTDEMFIVYFHYMVYQAGDENYDMEALMSASIDELLPPQQGPLMTYPNPFSTSTQIVYANAKAGDVVSVSIYDYQGKLIRQLKNAETLSTSGVAIEWDGTTDAGADARKGIYFVSMTVNGQPFTAQLIRN